MTSGSPPKTGVAIDIDGVRLDRVERPDTPAQLAELLACAAAEGKAVAPVGGGTKLGYGNAPNKLDVAVSTRKLNKIVSFEPTDLTLSVEAGATLAEVQAALGEHGQWLPIDAAFPERATIGGLIATALNGPRRLGSETFRDLLIGISVAHPSGAVSKAGGMVVKNVTGFDMMRLYLGSLGTLGVIVSANFKTLPRPRMERTLLISLPTLEAALGLASRFLESRVRPVALEIEESSKGWTLAARVEGRHGAVEILTRDAIELAGHRTVEQLEQEASARWWQNYVNRQPVGGHDGKLSIRAYTRPRNISALATGAIVAAEQLPSVRLAVSPGLGEVRIVAGAASASVESVLAIRAALSPVADNVVIITPYRHLKRDIDVWGATPETIDVMKALKQQFDPERVLNPGRFAGFI